MTEGQTIDGQKKQVECEEQKTAKNKKTTQIKKTFVFATDARKIHE